MNETSNFLNISQENMDALLDERRMSAEELDLFRKGKDFIDKAFELEPNISDNTKLALVCYCIEKYKRFNIIR